MSFDYCDLPHNWAKATIGEICWPPQYGWTTSADSRDTGAKLLRTTDITCDGGINWNTVPFCTEPPANISKYALCMGDIVISRAGSVGVSQLLTDPPENVVFASYLIRFRPLMPDLAKYLAFFMKSSDYWRQISEKSSGIALANVNARKLETVALPIPPEPEQRRIVAKIEELFSDLDAAVAALERVKANLKRYRAAVLKAAVEGKLTAEWRKKNPATESGEQLLKRILAERRKKWEEDQLKKFAEKGKVPPSGWKGKYQEPESPEVAGLAELPAGWCWAALGQLAERCEYGTSVKCGYEGSGTPVVRIPNIAMGVLDLTDLKFSVLPVGVGPDDGLSLGDILVCRTNGSLSLLGKTALVAREIRPPHGFASYLLRFRFLLRQGLPSWVNNFMGSSAGRHFIESRAASSAGQHNISLGVLVSMCVPLPPIAEQEQIIAEVERRLSVADAVAAQVERSLKRAARLRQSILKRAFEGKLVAQNPADEPASVLLERIKAQRAVVPERPATGQKRVGTPALPGRGGHVAQPVARPTQPTRKERKLSRKVWLARATIAAYGVQALVDQPTFGRVQLQKFLYLAQAHIGLDLQFEFEKQAAGPFDRDIYTVESNAVKRQWISITGERGDATHYHPGVEIQDRLEWAGRMFKKQLPAIDELIGHLRNMNTDQAELFATIHAVWNELVKGGKPCGEEEIVKGVYAWHESKKRFTAGIIRTRIKWMRENGYGAGAPGGEMSNE